MTGVDWTDRYPWIAQDVGRLKVDHAIIDAECCCDGENGIADFNRLQARLYDASAYAYAFDLLAIDGTDTRALPLSERKEALAHLSAEQGSARHSLQRASRRQRRRDIRASLSDGSGRHRVEKAHVALSVRKGKDMVEDQKSEVARNVAVRRQRVMFDPASDLNDSKPWTRLDFHYLKIAMGKGYSIEQAAAYLNRRGTLREVEEMARDLGWIEAPPSAPE